MITKETFLKNISLLKSLYNKHYPGFDFDDFLNKVFNRYFYEINQIAKYNKQQNRLFLEIGSSPFVFSGLLKLSGFNFFSVDLKPQNFSKIIDELDLKVKQVDIEVEKLPFDDNSFDYIHFSEVFEHLRINPFFTLEEIKRVLSNQGIVYFSTPNFYSVDNLIRIVIGQGFRDGFEEFYKLLTDGYPGHIREYTTKEIKKFLDYTGFKVLDIEYKFFGRSRYWLINVMFKIFKPLRAIQIFVIKKKG